MLSASSVYFDWAHIIPMKVRGWKRQRITLRMLEHPHAWLERVLPPQTAKRDASFLVWVNIGFATDPRSGNLTKKHLVRYVHRHQTPKMRANGTCGMHMPCLLCKPGASLLEGPLESCPCFGHPGTLENDWSARVVPGWVSKPVRTLQNQGKTPFLMWMMFRGGWV